MIKDIDYALVEEKRPPMYTSMKYWGKKPHNIWNEYIKTYTKENDIVLDPFSGSAVAAFEAVRCNRKAIAFDINPLTSFIIDVYSTEFDRDKFENAVREIYDNISKDECYNSYYNIKCTECGNNNAIIQHFKWENNKIYEYGIECPNCKKRYLCKSDRVQED
ncbi:MAG: site-specific DNA-methyltransferase, partial [Clostridiales bacterium]|nr:site-specific DNA-methyltransferase [Clostridiales bacterium]